MHSVVYRWKDQRTDQLLSQFKVQNLYRWHRHELTGLWPQWKTTSQEDDNLSGTKPQKKTPLKENNLTGKWHTGRKVFMKTASYDDNFMRRWPHSKTQSQSIYYFFKIRPSLNLQEHFARACYTQPDSESLNIVSFQNTYKEWIFQKCTKLNIKDHVIAINGTSDLS